jgi:hypothetical protein
VIGIALLVQPVVFYLSPDELSMTALFIKRMQRKGVMVKPPELADFDIHQEDLKTSTAV